MAVLYAPPQQNGLQKSLDAQLDEGVTASMTLNNTTGVQNLPGVVVVNRIDSSGNELSPSVREFIIYQGTSGSTLTNLTRGIGGSSDQDHAVGSVVEFVPDISVFQSIYDALANLVDVDTLAVDTTKVVTPTGADFNGNKVILDADADTSITADTDDRIDIEVGGSDRFRMGTSDLDIVTATGNIQVNATDPWRTVSIKNLRPTTTGGCGAAAVYEIGTNKIDIVGWPFDQSSDESAFIEIPSPTSYDGGVIQFRVEWTTQAGGASETVEFEMAGRSYADDEAIDQAPGTAVAVTDTWTADEDTQFTEWSTDLTLAGTPAGGESWYLKITRDVSADDLGGDAIVKSVQIRYRQSQFSD